MSDEDAKIKYEITNDGIKIEDITYQEIEIVGSGNVEQGNDVPKIEQVDGSGEPIVPEDQLVTISIPDGQEIKIFKSILINDSPKMRDLIDNDEIRKKKGMIKINIKRIPMAEITLTDFLNFFSILSNPEYVFTGQENLALAAWAAHYQVGFMKYSLHLAVYETFAAIMKRKDFDPDKFDKILEYLLKLKYEEVMFFLFEFITGSLDENNYLEFYNVAEKYSCNGFTRRIVDYIAENVDPVNSWPAGLLFLVSERLKASNLELKDDVQFYQMEEKRQYDEMVQKARRSVPRVAPYRKSDRRRARSHGGESNGQNRNR